MADHYTIKQKSKLLASIVSQKSDLVVLKVSALDALYSRSANEVSHFLDRLNSSLSVISEYESEIGAVNNAYVAVSLVENNLDKFTVGDSVEDYSPIFMDVMGDVSKTVFSNIVNTVEMFSVLLISGERNDTQIFQGFQKAGDAFPGEKFFELGSHLNDTVISIDGEHITIPMVRTLKTVLSGLAHGEFSNDLPVEWVVSMAHKSGSAYGWEECDCEDCW